MNGSPSRDATRARGRAKRGTPRAAILSLALLVVLTTGSAVGVEAASRDDPERSVGVVCGLAHAGGYSVVCARRPLPTLEPRPDGALLSISQRPTR